MQDSNDVLGDALTSREINRAMKDIFKETFHSLGGAAWLTQFVMESPANARVFVQILGKLIPPQAAEQKGPTGQVIELAWVNSNRLSYRSAPPENLQVGDEVLQEQ